jgi:antitoxin ParD1/3/4
MTTMNISIPEPMREWVETQVEKGAFGSASEYVRSLIREDQKRQAEEELEAKLLEGINSGEATPMTREDWERLRARLAERFSKKRGS